MTNLEWLLSMPVEDMEKRFHREECTCCIYDNSEECDNRSCVEGKLKWLSKERVPELKPCPCCGGEAVLADTGVYCNDCGIGTTFGVKTIEDAIKTWNRRIDND